MQVSGNVSIRYCRGRVDSPIIAFQGKIRVNLNTFCDLVQIHNHRYAYMPVNKAVDVG